MQQVGKVGNCPDKQLMIKKVVFSHPKTAGFKKYNNKEKKVIIYCKTLFWNKFEIWFKKVHFDV